MAVLFFSRTKYFPPNPLLYFVALFINKLNTKFKNETRIHKTCFWRNTPRWARRAQIGSVRAKWKVPAGKCCSSSSGASGNLVWLDWDTKGRVNAMSVEDMLKGKRVSVGTADKTSTCSNREFQELSFDAAKVLREKNICPEDIITAVIEGAVALLNLPAAIQQKATLDAYKATNTFEVASRDAKNGKVECTVNKDHVKCRCHSFKYDSVCKHSIAVAERVGMLEEHIRHITKSSRKRPKDNTSGG